MVTQNDIETNKMLNEVDNINRHSFNLSLGKNWRIVLLFFLLPAFSALGQPDDDPQLLIYRFENEIKGITSYQKDSIKYALQSSYIQEFRNSGKETAYDSLQVRVKRLLTGNGTDPEKMTSINTSAKAKSEKKDNSPAVKKQKYDAALVAAELKRTRKIADSLTAQALKMQKKAVIEPVYFDSISHADFLNYFQIPQLSYKSTVDTTQLKYNSLEQKASAYRFLYKQKRRAVSALAISGPELIEYYNLPMYDDKSDDIRKSGKVITVDVDEYKTTPARWQLSSFRKNRKQSNWSSKGKLNVQFSQYYVTKNWHKGGDPNATLLSLLEYQKDYNKDDKLIWNNTLDVRIGFFNSGVDTLRAIRVNNDVFKITSQLGYQTSFHKKWYYSLYSEFNTSMFTGYAGTNSSEVVTAFFSPTRLFTSLGLDYRYNRNTAILIAPLAHKLIFLINDKIDPLSVGIAEGKSSNCFGYMLQAKTNWKFSYEISVNSNFNLFSTYNFQNVEFNWETVGNFMINRYLGTRLSLIMRYDNTPKKPDKSDSKNQFKKPKLQVQEQLSIGFYYKF